MYNFFNKNIVVQIVLLTLLVAICGIQLFGKIEMALPNPGNLLYEWLFDTLHDNRTLLLIVVICVLFFQLLLLQFLVSKNNFFESTNLFPSIWYLSLLLSGGFFNVISPLFFVNLFIILILVVNINYDSISIKNRVFFSGILIGLTAFIDFSAVLLLLFIILSLVVNRFSKGKEIFISIFGVIIPVLYFFTYGFLTDNLAEMVISYQEISFFGFINSFQLFTIWDIIFFILLFASLFYILFYLKVLFSNKLIVMRKRLVTVNMLLLVVMVAILTSPHQYPSFLLYLLMPLSIYFSLIQSTKNRWILHDVMIIILIMILWL